MIKYSIHTLYSGSGGNSVFIATERAKILIDAGKSARSLCSALSLIGEDIDNIDAIFVTHEHTDHISALEVIEKKHRIPIHITERSAKKLMRCPDAPVCSALKIHSALFSVELDGMTVTSFATPHDSLMSVGYRIDLFEGEEKLSIGVATDIGYITDDIRDGLMGCESVVIESNHDIEMLEGGIYPEDLKRRIRSRYGHLSNADCAILASELVEGGTKNILLAHLSEENNRPDIAYNEVLSAIADESVRLLVASADEPTLLISTLGGAKCSQ